MVTCWPRIPFSNAHIFLLCLLKCAVFTYCGGLAMMATGGSPPPTPANCHIDCFTSSTKQPKGNCVSEDTVLKPMDCSELLLMGHRRSGVYTVWPRNKILDGRQLDVYCDMETDKGGWTVLQRRGNFSRPNDYFYRDWMNYKVGFGDIERDFWLGNDNIFALTNQKLYSVRFDLVDFTGLHLHALYDSFYIENEENKYKLHAEDYSGTANDSLLSHNGSSFSTKDQDNDNYDKNHCAQASKGGWWYINCFYSNLNGFYYPEEKKHKNDGIVWQKWRKEESLRSTEIKIRPKSFRKSLV